MRLIRFNKNSIEKYKKSISILKKDGPVISGSRPYLGILHESRIVSAIWIDEFNEISIITLNEYRNQGMMTKLLNQVIDDVFNDKLEDVCAMPMNRKSLRLLKKVGFFKSEENKFYLEFYVK